MLINYLTSTVPAPLTFKEGASILAQYGQASLVVLDEWQVAEEAIVLLSEAAAHALQRRGYLREAVVETSGGGGGGGGR